MTIEPTPPPQPAPSHARRQEYKKIKNSSGDSEKNVREEVSLEEFLEEMPWAIASISETKAISSKDGRFVSTRSPEDIEEFLKYPNTFGEAYEARKKGRRQGYYREWYEKLCFLPTPEDDFAVVVLPNAYREWKRIGGRQQEVNGKKQWTKDGREVWEERPTYEKIEEIKPRSLEILKELRSYTEVAPNRVDLHVYILGKLPERALAEFRLNRKKVRVYDQGRFCPVTAKRIPGYDLPIRNCQAWLDEHVPLGAAVEDKGHKARRSRITPVPLLPENLMMAVSQMRTGVWKTEFKTDENGEKKKLRLARTPTTRDHEVIRWNEDDFEAEKHKWGSYSESYLAFEQDRDLDGIVLLIEPTMKLRPEEKGSPYPVFLDIDDCRNLETGEITIPWVRELLKMLGTYAEVSPSGKGVRIVGWARRHPRSKADLTDVAERLGAKIDFQIYGASGGRHLITITGCPLPGYDLPVQDMQDWVDEVVPLHELPSEDDEPVTPEPLNIEDEELKQKMLSSEGGRLLRRFFDGDESLWKEPESRYADRSRADVGFFERLAWWTRHDRNRIKRIAFSSEMRRKKWEREDYLDDARGRKGIITLGIEGCKGSYYDPSYSSKPELVERLWAARSALKDFDERSSWGALLALGQRYGTWSRAGFVWKVKNVGDQVIIPEKGIVVHAAIRTLMPLMGTDLPSKAHDALKKLREAGYAKRIWKSKNGMPDLYLIPESVISRISASEGSPTLTPPPCLYLLCSINELNKDREVVRGESGEPPIGTYEKLVWIQSRRKKRPGLSKKEKLIFELILSGQITHLNEMTTFLGVDRKNLIRNVKSLVDLSLIDRDSDYLSLPDGFEQAIHSLFVESGGEQQYLDTLSLIERHRTEYAALGEEANDVRRRTLIERGLLGEIPPEDLAARERDEVTPRLLSQGGEENRYER